jgi:hypothetical protein
MALTPDEIVKCRAHMGYPNISAVSTYALGVPAAMQTTFMIEGAMVKVLPQAESRLRYLLEKLDKAECKIDDVLDVVEMTKAEDVEFNQEALPRLARIYKIHQQGLANLLGIVPNPHDQREWLAGAGGINVPVMG